MLLSKKLENMNGNLFLFHTIQYRIIDYKIDADRLYLSTDKKLFIWNLLEAELRISEFMPVEEEYEQNKALALIDDGTTANLMQVLLTSIDKVQTDPEYIKVADSINRTTQTMINVFKTALILDKSKNGK